MRDISDKILSGTGRYTARLVWDGGELSSEEIRDWTVTSSLNGSSDRLTLGATPAAQLTANVVTDAKLLDRKVRLYIGRGGEEVSVGVFTVTAAPAVDGVVTLTGYDAMYTAMERGYYPTVSGTITARAVLADAAQAAGLALVLPDGLDAPVSGIPGGYTLREVVGYMAALLGCNARIDGDGALRVQWFSASGLTLDGDSIYSGGASLAGEDWTLGKLTCSVTTTTTTTDEDGVTSRTDSTENQTSGDGATGVSMSNPWMTQNLLDGIFSRIGMTYRSGEVSALGDLRVEVGDVVTAMGETFPVMGMTLEYDGGLRMTLSAYAESESDGGGEGVSGPMTTAMERYAVELAQIRELDAQRARITRAHINQLNADKASVDDLTAVKADIETLTADKLDAEDAAIKYATIDFSNIGEAAVTKLFTAAGIIKDLVVSEGHITGELVGVTIKGDLIEGGTVKADRLVVKGSDGLYYKLNTDGETVEAEQTKENSLNGSVIAAKSITATKIAVDDLVAFGATIGGFHISDKSMYSGTKASVDNTTQGIYLDSTGQLATGDSTRYLKHYKDSAGVWHLEICTDELLLSSGKTVSGAIDDAQKAADKAQESVDGLQVGGRNYITKSANLDGFSAESNCTWSDQMYTRGADNGGRRYGIYKNTPLIMEAGESLTLSVDVESISGTMQIGVCSQNDVTYNWGVSSYAEVNTDGRHSVTVRFYAHAAIRVYICSAIPGTTCKLSNVKLESGNVATDWTPAPEDVDDDISGLEGKLQLCLTQDDSGKIISMINESADEINIKSNRLTIESTNFQLTADGTVTATAGKIGGWELMQDTVNGVKRQYLFGGYKADNKLYGIKLLPQPGTDDWDGEIDFFNGAEDTAISIYAARKDVYDGFNYLAISGAPVVVQNLQISSGGNIYMPSGKSVIDEAVDAVQIGGRNLVPGTATMAAWRHGSKLTVALNQTGPTGASNAAKIVNSEGTGGSAWFEYPAMSTRTYEAGYYTVSFWAQSNAENGAADVTVVFANSIYKAYRLTSAWRKYVAVFELNSAYTSNEPLWINVTGTSAVYIASIKMERGNKATDWTPAPEDVDADISALSTDYIVAEDISGAGWLWRKWSSGQAECWSYWSIYYANPNVLTRTIALPFTFSAVDACVAASNNAGGNSSSALNKNTKVEYNNTSVTVVIHNSSGGFSSGASERASVLVLGRWK